MPKKYKSHKDFWIKTVSAFIHDTDNGNKAELSLALAIDMLWPCHWNFEKNLLIILGAIGGNLYPDKPFASCGRNIALIPDQKRLKKIINTLEVFCGKSKTGEVDRKILNILGNTTQEKLWLAASLAKTIQLQLNPPIKMRKASALITPEWVVELKSSK